MAYCTNCGNSIKLFSGIKVALEIDYGSGLYITHRNVCSACDREIAVRNDLFIRLHEYWSEHTNRLQELEAIHESELQL